MNQQIIMNISMSRLQAQNPLAFNQINQAINSGANPMEFMKQVMGNISPQEMQNIMVQAKQFAVPNEILKQVQNGINK